MKRRSAMVLAGALASALLAGLVAVSLNVGIVRAVGTPKGPGHLGTEPVVQTIEDIVHETRPGDPEEAPVITITRTAPPTGTATGGSASGEHEDHESDGEHEFGEGDDD
jgi:hypothetical protein